MQAAATSKNLTTSPTKAYGNPNEPGGMQEDGSPDVDQVEVRLQEQLKKAQVDADKYTKNDQDIKRKDTVEVVIDILNRIKTVADEINKMTQSQREKLYYLTFNCTIMIFKLAHQLREGGFSKEATHFLAYNLLCLDNNLILTTAKYLDWRVLNYVELARAYSDITAFKAAIRVISYGIQKVLYLKQIEEQDPPVPDGTKETLVEALRVLRTQELKYQLQAGIVTPEVWKKKIEETFNQNKYHRSLAIVECLNANDPNNNRLVQRSAKNLTVKTQCLKICMDFFKADIELIKQALIQIHEKKKRDRDKKEQLLNKEADHNIDELLEKYKVLDQEMIKEKDWKFACYNVPIEVHVELLKFCFECKLWAEFELLLDPALVRLKFRRYETPYLATIDVLMSASKLANIPNGFEKIPKDLNAANLRIELKRLRAQAKMSGGDGGAKPKEEDKKKEDAKKAPANQPPAKQAPNDPKKKVDPKAAQQQQQEIPKDEEDENQIQASEAELDKIKHIYVNLLLQRTKNSQNAIVGVDVVLADENVGPNLPDNHFAVAVPIRQHQGVYEKSKLIPYIVFKRTANALIDEEDCLSIVTDIAVVMGQDAHLRAPLGYHKIPVDLRQTPKDLERVPNLDYVFICYKTDKQLALTERDLLMFRRLADLEKSYIEKNTPEYKQLDEARSFMQINYNMETLVDLSRTIKESLLGPLGDYYLEQRQDVLFDATCLLWSKYLLPVLQRVDTYIEMRHQREYNGEFVELMDEQVIQIKHHFVEAFNVMHRILTRMNFVEDTVMYTKFAIYLASFQEELGEFRNAVQTLRSALGKVVEYREERLKQSLDAKENIRTSMSITVDNKKIGDLESKINTVYETWEQLILRKERDRTRRENQEAPLDEDEGDEEQSEVQQCIDELKNKDLFERNISVEEWRKTMRQKNQLQGVKYFNEQEQIIHSLHTDLLVNLYRCEIKLGREMQVVKNQTSKLLISQGIDLSKNAPGNISKNLATSLNTKMNQSKNKTLAKSKNDLTNLKQTLQEAGKLPPPKPQIQSYEKILEKENNHNPYQNALLHMCLAVAKQNIVEQKSLLLESIEYLKKAKQEEENLSNLALENAIYIKAASHYHEYFSRSADQVHPFNLMAKQQYIKSSNIPTKPIMICRTSTSIVMKLPFYKPITEYKSWKNITQMALFGKPSGSGVGVSLNNTEYDGTGEKKPMGDVVKVTELIPNEKYVFAAGGYTGDGICVNGIGETSNEIITLLPLSLHQLYGYLAEIAYKLGHYQIAKQAAETLCSSFIEKNEFKYSFLDTRINPILAFKLNQEYLSLISPIEAKQLAEAFLILAKVSKVVKSDVQKRADIAELKVEKQKIDMKICNYLLIALDISIAINQPVLIKRSVSEVFNHLIPYFSMNLRPQLLFQILFKCHQSVRQIPQELIDSNMRKILGCLSYQLLRLGFEYQEDESFKRIMISELPTNTRKWRKYIQYLIRRPQLPEELKFKKDEQEKRISLGEKIPESDLIREPEPYEEKVIKAEEFELEGASFEEFLLSLIDYQDVVKAKLERWKLQINRYQKQITQGNENVEKLKEGLVQIVEFWEGIKLNNPQVYINQILQAYDAGQQNPRYLEFCCKCVRRSMELGLQQYPELEEILSNKIKILDDVISSIENKLAERLEYLDKDIVRKQRKRFNLLEQKVQQMQEKQTISGGNKTTSLQKIQELMDDQMMDEEDYFGIIQFDTDDDLKYNTYQYLWISEKLLLQGICQFLGLTQIQAQRSLIAQQAASYACVYNDILQIDFNKYKQALDEYNEKQKQVQRQFEEEHKKDNEKFVLKVDDRVKRMTAFLKIMSRAAEYARNSRCWLQLENIIRYTWNALTYDMTTPLELKDTEGWKYVVLIAEAGLYLVEYLKGGGTLRKPNSIEIDEVRNQKPTMLKEPGKTVAFKIQSEDDIGGGGNLNHDQSTNTIGTSKSGAMGIGGKGLKWFEKIAEFDISIHASFITFSVQCLMGVKKWESLVDISNRLNTATENTYAQYLLPFIIYAQTTLYEDSASKTNSKRNDLQIRIQQFENWKATNKKKRSRQAMITGEIPPEEQEFLRDKASLEKEIFRLEIIEGVLNTDKQQSENLLENIKRDANNCEESLKACRKLYFQFGVETQNLRIEELKKGLTHFDIKSKRKGHKVYTSMVISNYKKCIELLRKRQEKLLLIQALHELGNLLYADGQLGEAEIQWNDCVDTIFQKLYVINQFRQVFKDNPQLADSFGSKQCLIGGIVLTKLAKLCYEGRDLYRYNECILMSAELFAAPARLSLPHPQSAIEYSNYRMREFLTDQLFVDKYILTASELIHTMGVVAQALIDADLFDKALPLASLMEYISSDITKSKQITIKARILKAIALTEIGYVNEAYQIYNRILSMKDLSKIGVRDSEFTNKKEGKNFYFPFNQRYYNNLPPESDKNAEAISNIQKALPADILNNFKKFCSPYIVELFQYLRAVMLIRIGESENVEMPEKADFRNQLLRSADDSLRTVLKNLAFIEEVSFTKDKLENIIMKEIDIPEQEIGDLKIKIAKIFEQGAVSEEEQRLYYSNKEEEMCYADRRSQLLSLMLRSRIAISRIQQKQGLLVQSFYILRQGLINFKQYAEGKHSKVETGTEAEDKGSFKLPEIYGGSGLGLPPADPKQAAKQAAQQKPPVQEQKKGPPGKGNALQQQQDEEEQKRQEEERKKREAQEEQKERDRVENAEKRDHPHIYLWLKIKVDIINILFHQKRYIDCGDAMAVTNLECSAINDLFFTRQLMEIQFMIEIYKGELEEAIKISEKIRKHASAYNQNDVSYAYFLGNLSEFLYNKDKRSEVNEIIKEGRLIMWYKLRDYGMDLDPSNINFKYSEIKVNKSRTKPSEDVLAQYQTAVPQPGAKGGAQQKPPAQQKPGPGGKGAQQQIPDDLPVEEEKIEPPLDFQNKIEYPLVPSDANINSSYYEPNIYIRYLEQTVRFDVRYSQYQSFIEKKHAIAKKILQDTERLIKRTLHISPQLKFYVNYLLGHSNLQLFYDQVIEFQSKYSSNKKYKESLTKHIPYGSIALDQYLIELPGFSEKLKKFYKDYLEWAKKSLKTAVDIAKSEAIVYEFDFNIVDALRELSEVNFLIMEYRVRSLQYKYAQYQALDYSRKVDRKADQKRELDQRIDDNLLEEIEKEIKTAKDDWEEQKLNKEKLEIANSKRQAIHYLEMCVAISKNLREFQDKQHLLGQVSLTDPSKIPREVASELFEAFQVTKVGYVKVPDFDPKDKAAITSAEIVSYLKALSKELEFMTFGEEKQRQSKLISKLHRYLKLNLASYVQKCSVDIKEPEEIKDPHTVDTLEYIQKGKILSKWSDFKTQKSSLYYIIGPIEEQLLNQIYPFQGELNQLDQRSKEGDRKDQQAIHFGKVEVDPLVLSALYQEVRDLVDKMKASEKLSPAQNERDRRGYRVKYDQLLERFGNLFKPPILNEEEADLDVNTYDLIIDILPDLTVDNVEKLAQLLQKDSGSVYIDPKINTILRRFHRLRYIR